MSGRDAFDLSPKLQQFVVYMLVSPVDMVKAVDFGGSFSLECSKHKGGRSPKVRGHDRGSTETLNPSHTVGGQIIRVIKKFGVAKNDEEVHKRVDELLDLVKLPRAFKYRKPRQLSGGQKQRIGIARAFAGYPPMVIADEPVSALDVSVQAAVTGLLMDIQRQYDTTLLFISHDLSVVRYLSDRVVVMYLGMIMEQGNVEEVYSPPYHPYTEALLSAVPNPDPDAPFAPVSLPASIADLVTAAVEEPKPPDPCEFRTQR